ncbi:TOX high mobility group box member 3 [Desmophyllum pertusum]|uniref:TOX high mobility group box member 3 n=1 Tax=Desmophyllum pertusum TaxID=174260 RepID=A0A9W9ZGZ4_9CNID|nr:TOX high mobility group box member 3 [Desmophyllum pertusum]
MYYFLGLQEKAQQEYQKAQEEYRAKKLSQEDEPSPKLRRVETTDAGPVTLEAANTAAVVAGSKPFGRAQSQVPMAGKPVATVPPMATSKTSSSAIAQPTVPIKPKKGKVTVNPISQRVCLCDGCNKPARTTKERGTQYCSNECIVKHCRLAFTVWVEQRNVKSEAS